MVKRGSILDEMNKIPLNKYLWKYLGLQEKKYKTFNNLHCYSYLITVIILFFFIIMFDILFKSFIIEILLIIMMLSLLFYFAGDRFFSNKIKFYKNIEILEVKQQLRKWYGDNPPNFKAKIRIYHIYCKDFKRR